MSGDDEVPNHHSVPWVAAGLSLWGIWRSINPVEPLPLAVFTFLFFGSLALRWIGGAVEQEQE